MMPSINLSKEVAYDLLHYGNAHWQSSVFRIVGTILLWVILLFTFSQIGFTMYTDIPTVPFYTITVICIMLYFGSCWIAKAPKGSKNTLNIGVSISTEGYNQRKAIMRNFIFQQRQLIDKRNPDGNMSLIVLPEYYARRCTTSSEARHLAERTNCLFMIYGRAMQVTRQAGEHTVLELNCQLRDDLVAEPIKKRLQTTIGGPPSTRWFIPRNLEFEGLELSSEYTTIVAQYMIAKAYLFYSAMEINIRRDPNRVEPPSASYEHLTDQLDFARSIFKEFWISRDAVKSGVPPMDLIRGMLPEDIATTDWNMSLIKYWKWQKSKDLNKLNDVKPLLDEIIQFDPTNTDARLFRAMWHFAMNTDCSSAFADLKRCERARDSTWQFSKAFLHAYQGDLQKAKKLYGKAFKQKAEQDVGFQVEDFIHWALEQEPDKTQLYFCLGLINWKEKDDKELAIENYKRFTQQAPKEFQEEKRLAEAHIETIKGEFESE